MGLHPCGLAAGFDKILSATPQSAFGINNIARQI
jgi:hypothetical protein